MCVHFAGPEAKKEFYKIRQKFGKELRKVNTSRKGKSGQAAVPVQGESARRAHPLRVCRGCLGVYFEVGT